MKTRESLIALAFGAVISLGVGSVAFAQSVGVTLPSVPTGVTATVVPPAQVSVSWSAATETAGLIEGYYIYRNGGQIGTTAGTSFVDTNVTPGYYQYTVTAYDANGVASAQSSQATVSLISDTTPPSTPTSLSVSGSTSTNSFYSPTTLTISWGASTDNVGVAGYFVYRNGTQIVSSSAAFTGTSLADIVTPGTYTYSVVAYDAAQNFSSHSAILTVTVSPDTTPPSAPANISVQQTSATGLNLLWMPSTDNVGVGGYQVFRDGMQIATVGGPPYADSGLSTGVQYAYSVAAFDTVGNVSARSTPIQTILQLVDGPGVPFILSAPLVGASTVHIIWSPSGDVLAITGYNVYRNNTQVATVTSTNYFDTDVAPGFYTYSVSASDASGAVSATSSMNVVVPVFTTSSVAVVPPVVIPFNPVTPPSTSVVPPGSTTGAPTTLPPVVGTTFTQFLYLGLTSPQVTALQSLLMQNGYLSTARATGYFGNLTLAALEKFQCDKGVACTGGAGWGTVGPRTRAALNALGGGATTSASVSTSASASAPTPAASSLAAQLQALEAELAALQAQTTH